MLNEKKIKVTLEKLHSLTEMKYSVNISDYFVDYSNGHYIVSVYWGRYSDPVDILVRYDWDNYDNEQIHNHNKIKSIYKLLPIVDKIKLLNKSEIERFKILADYLILNYDKIIADM